MLVTNIINWVYNRIHRRKHVSKHDARKKIRRHKPKNSVELQTMSPFSLNPITLTVVLDMDETLIHAIELDPGIDYASCTFDIIVMFGDKQRYGVYARPMLQEFLSYCAKHFELILFTAATRAYAQQVVNAIDPHGHIKYRFYRDSCLDVNGILTKPVQNLGRQMDRIVLVDNSELCMLSCSDNGVVIPAFKGDPLDCDLNKLADLLTYLHGLKDVRPFLIKKFRLRERFARSGVILLDSPGGPFSPVLTDGAGDVIEYMTDIGSRESVQLPVDVRK